MRTRLAERRFARVLASPLGRALDTCRLAGFGDQAEIREELVEWDYGEYEGTSTPEIRERRPDWWLWRDGCPGGETAADVAARVKPVVEELRQPGGDAVVFAHGHLLRVFAALWVDLDPEAGALLALDTAAVSLLGWERDVAVIRQWNT